MNKKTPKDIYYDLCDKYIETMDRGDIVEMAMIEYAEQQVKLFAIPDVRFQLPSDQQVVELAVLFNDGSLDKEILTKMVSLADFIINRLYENGDISKQSSKERNMLKN